MKNTLSSFTRRLPSQLESELSRFFGSSLFSEPFLQSDFVPACEIKETDKQFAVSFDMPGMKKEDIKIEVDGNRLTVRGERKEEREEKDAKRHFSESYYGSFARSFMLPLTIDEKAVKAQYEDGVLKLTIPKSQNGSSKSIPVS